jgi:hypothetical protein
MYPFIYLSVIVLIVYVFIYTLAIPGNALLWLSLVKWKRKKRESARF